jgi:hypothetical protein
MLKPNQSFQALALTIREMTSDLFLFLRASSLIPQIEQDLILHQLKQRLGPNAEVSESFIEVNTAPTDRIGQLPVGFQISPPDVCINVDRLRCKLLDDAYP